MFLCDHAFGAVPAQEHLKKRRNETNGIMQTKTCQQYTPNDHRDLKSGCPGIQESPTVGGWGDRHVCTLGLRFLFSSTFSPGKIRQGLHLIADL